ncbi:NUDIX domain-containing protein [Tabrizicola sp. J26]|uniref:NUDIX domain-containing protein n=1 Tax=Alitabrizicola rongguiensis TaxID=2909234 RepID=UPI001F473481|nr:NUDIX domain-containing protein [Tabrizicola rongguiensis]MCF1710228.1 NUDIX domain-containing protein [Tabrizicola rongguiensis]
MSADVFLHGALALPVSCSAILGREAASARTRLADHAIVLSEDDPWPLLLASEGEDAEGVVLRLDATALSRLEFLADVLDQSLALVTIATTAGGGTARALVPRHPPSKKVIPLQSGPWTRQWAATLAATVEDVLALQGQAHPAQIRRRLRLMMVRASSRVRALASPAPATLRHDARPGDVATRAIRQPYANFFAVEEYELRHVRFRGGLGPEVNRAVFISGDAVTVLPYDPVRDRVLLIEQFRPGPLARGDAQPWLLEAIAGRIDPGETPEESARREAVEEAGLVIGQMHFAAGYYPSPGAKAEYLYSYVALTDLPDGSAGTFGLAEESEDIRGHLIGFERLMELTGSGEINNAPLLVTVMWLAANRDRLRAGGQVPY